MAATVNVVDILASDVPFFDVENLITENLIGVSEAVEDESNFRPLALVTSGTFDKMILLVCDSFAV